jgi:hypothetical protein
MHEMNDDDAMIDELIDDERRVSIVIIDPLGS